MKQPLSKIKKILVAIDFSSYSKEILEYAVEMAGITNARIFLINIINEKETVWIEKAVNSNYPNSFSLKKHLSDETSRREFKLRALIKEVNGLTELPVRILIGNGVPYVEILDAIDREWVDLLIIGPKGQSDLQGYRFGSVAEKLFRHSPVPVITLRSRQD
jgi:nucleotide-binding universal stress UspA family protein